MSPKTMSEAQKVLLTVGRKFMNLSDVDEDCELEERLGKFAESLNLSEQKP